MKSRKPRKQQNEKKEATPAVTIHTPTPSYEDIIISEALVKFKEQEYQAALDLLSGVYQNGQTDNIRVQQLYTYASGRLVPPIHNQEAYTQWSRLCKHSNKYLTKELSGIPLGIYQEPAINLVIKSLLSMIRLTNNLTLTENFLEKLLKDSNEFFTDKTQLKSLHIEAYTQVADRFNLATQEVKSDFALQKTYLSKAKNYFEKAFELDKSNLLILLTLANIQIHLEQNLLCAVQLLLQYKKQFTKNGAYLHNLAKLYEDSGNKTEAESYRERSKKYLKIDEDEALMHFFNEANDNSSYDDITLNSALKFFTQGKYDEARAIILELLKDNACDYNKALMLLADIEDKCENFSEAEEACNRLLEIDENCVFAMNLQAKYLYLEEDPFKEKMAIDLCERAYELGSREDNILNILLTHYRYRQGGELKFLDYAIEVSKIYPSAKLYIAMGRCYIDLRKYQEAHAIFEKAKKFDDTESSAELAVCFIITAAASAETNKDYKTLAAQIRCYLKNLGPDKQPDPVVVGLIDLLKYMEIIIDPTNNHANPPIKTETNDPIVPPDIKEKTLCALANISFANDIANPQQEEVKSSTDSFDDLKIKAEDLTDISDLNRIKGCISEDIKDELKLLSPDLLPKFETALASRRFFFFTSKNKSGTKFSRKKPNTYKLKIDGDMRLIGQGRFFKEIVIGEQVLKNITIVVYDSIKKTHR